MDNIEFLVDLLKNKEFDTINLETLSNLVGKNIFSINKIFFVLPVGDTIGVTAEELLNMDPSHNCTLYLTLDKYLQIPNMAAGAIRPEEMTVSAKTADAKDTQINCDFNIDGDYINIKLLDPQNELKVPCQINIYIEQENLNF